MGLRPHAPLPAGTCFSRPGRRSPTSATVFDARAHPTSCRSSHASGAFAPLLAGTNRCRLRWSSRASPRGRPTSRDLHPSVFRQTFPLARGWEITGRSARAKARASLDDIARTLLVTPRAPVSPVRFAKGPWGTRRHTGPAEIPFGCHLAKGGTVERIEVPSVATEPLRERRIAPSRAPGSGPLHAASERHCSGVHTPFLARHPTAPPSDEASTGSRIDPRSCARPKPLEIRGSQRP